MSSVRLMDTRPAPCISRAPLLLSQHLQGLPTTKPVLQFSRTACLYQWPNDQEGFHH